MSGGEQFSLCWDSFHKNLTTGMQALLETEDLVDVTLAVEGKYLKAHKMVLSLCSPYFRELFSVNPCKHPIVFMKDVSYLALSDLLTFMYQGEVQVNQEHLGTFIKTAEALQIKGLTGDNNSPQDNDVSEIPDESPVEEPPIPKPKYSRHDDDMKPTSTSRLKKQYHQPVPGPSPAAKRQKMSTPEGHSRQTPKVENSAMSSSMPSSHEILQFKVEPYEAGDQSNIENIDDNQGDNFDETVDEAHVDDTEDYSMIEGEEEPQAGTSAEGMGDGQDVILRIEEGGIPFEMVEVKDDKERIKKRRSIIRTRYVFGGFVYHNKVISGQPPVRYLGCAEVKKSGCRARAIIPVNGTIDQLRVTKPHNHPPDENAEEKEEFLRQLKDAARTMPGSLKKVYDNVATIYPKGAEEVPFRSICSSLHRWRRAPDNF